MNDMKPKAPIKPTVGRVVWYKPLPHEPGAGEPHLAAIIAKVLSDTRINVMVIDHRGGTYQREDVFLWDGSDATPTPTSYCQWMPYQQGQAAKTEKAEEMIEKAKAEIARIENETKKV